MAGTSTESNANESRASGALFYIALIVVVTVLFLRFGGSDAAPRSVMGFAAMNVLSASMQDEIPKGSLVIVKEVDPQTLRIGDDITYLKNANTTVTHRIVGITENYAGTGERGFTTQGVMNANPDGQIVFVKNVVGKVVFHNLALGQATGFVRKFALYIVVFTVLIAGLAAALRVVFSGGGRRRGAGVNQESAD